MGRLTDEVQIGPFAALKDKAEAVPGAFGTHECFYAHVVAVTRLKQYEDTGLEPEDIDALQKREQGLAELLVNISCGCAVSYTRLAELAQAEKNGRLVELPSNDPLTLDELREMDGEPVWCVCETGSGYGILWCNSDYGVTISGSKANIGYLPLGSYRKTWRAYRRKPEEGTK